MVAIIHPGKCDQAKECSCPSVCAVKAWHRDEKDEIWIIDEEKCNNCGSCAKECPAEAVFIAKTPEEKQRILKEIKEDVDNTKAKLFTERYGAMPVLSEIKKMSDLHSKIKSSNPVIVEFFNNHSILCLIKCLQYRVFAPELEVCKVNVDKHKELASVHNLKKFPCLLIFKNEKELGRIEGFIANENKLKRFVREVIDEM